MKKILSMVLACVLLFGCMLALASCSNVTESYAKKVNEAAEAGEHYTYDEVKEDLGEDVVDLTAEVFGIRGGWLYAVKGCSTWDEIQEKIDAGETVKGVVVSIVNGKAVSATYKEITDKEN
jgi:hypothetical protein